MEALNTAVSLDKKGVELRIPGHARRAWLTGGVDDQCVIGSILESGGLYEPWVMQRIQSILEPDSISLDIGANIGAISIVMGWASPHGRVYSFEASSTNYEHLCRSLGDNTAGNVVPQHLALYDERTTLEISYVPQVAGCSFLSPTGVREGVTEKVEALPLDDWVDSSDIGSEDRIRMIKMDVEGAESRVLRGAQRTIESHRPDLLIEFNPTPIERFFDEDPRQLAETLLDLYPSVEIIDPKDGALAPIESFVHLMQWVDAGPGWVDLYCRFPQ